MFRDAFHLLSRPAVVATTASLDAEALYSARGPAGVRTVLVGGLFVAAYGASAYQMMNIGRRRWVRSASWRGWGSIEPSAWRTFERRRSRGRPPVDRGALRR